MTRLRAAIIAAALALPTTAQAGALADHPDIGPVLGIREYATRVMAYCFDTVQAKPLYMESAENWRVQNVNDLAILERAIQRVAPTAADWEQVDGLVDPEMEKQVGASDDPVGYCDTMASNLVSGNFDLKDAVPDALQRLRAAD